MAKSLNCTPMTLRASYWRCEGTFATSVTRSRPLPAQPWRSDLRRACSPVVSYLA
jgi:hypothetical protein